MSKPNKSKKIDIDPLVLEDLKRAFGLLRKPKNYKEHGQNFLLDREVRDEIIKAAQIKPEDSILEIGPGAGVLTVELVKKAKRVVALDIDPYLLEIARMSTGEPDNLELLLEDVRHINLPKLFCDAAEPAASGNYKVVSNLPFLLTGYVLELLLTSTCSPTSMILMVQKEVADRILAEQGSHTVLSMSVQVFGKASRVIDVPSEMFWPKPKVNSAVIRIDRHEAPVIDADAQKAFFRVVKAGFSQRRKKLANSLSAGLHLGIDEARKLVEEAGLGVNARAQELSIEEWAQLSQKIMDKKYI